MGFSIHGCWTIHESFVSCHHAEGDHVTTNHCLYQWVIVQKRQIIQGITYQRCSYLYDQVLWDRVMGDEFLKDAKGLGG